MNRLKELRQEKKLTQKELADKIGIHYRTLQNWENNKTEIKPDKAEKLADFFEVSVGYLLGYLDYKRIEEEALLYTEKGGIQYRALNGRNMSVDELLAYDLNLESRLIIKELEQLHDDLVYFFQALIEQNKSKIISEKNEENLQKLSEIIKQQRKPIHDMLLGVESISKVFSL